jgi:transposase
MPAVRSSMRKIKYVLRLKFEANLSCRQIAASLKLSVGVISKYTQRKSIGSDSEVSPQNPLAFQ